MKNIFTNKVVLITGGTGFLGRALTTEILKYKPKSIRLYSRDEYKHYQIQEIFNHNPKLRNFIGDVRDYKRLRKAMKGVNIVIHAAALKRIDIIEYNVEEAIRTNIMGTLNVVDACIENNVKIAVMISSDKACEPVNTYGACKFVGERIFTESNFNKGNAKTVFTCVRYGNVLESTGSVIPFFINKIKNKKIIPLTDEKMTRFIITPKQSVDLIFKAIRYSSGGEIFVPKLPSFKIIDLISVLKDYYKSNNKIDIIGLRPGEKIHELMINESESPRTYKFKDMFIITSQIEKYQKYGYKYLNKSKLIDFGEFSSKYYLISKEEIRKILLREGILE